MATIWCLGQRRMGRFVLTPGKYAQVPQTTAAEAGSPFAVRTGQGQIRATQTPRYLAQNRLARISPFVGWLAWVCAHGEQSQSGAHSGQ